MLKEKNPEIPLESMESAGLRILNIFDFRTVRVVFFVGSSTELFCSSKVT